MNTPIRFSEGLMVALVLTVAGALSYEMLYWLVGYVMAAKLTLSLLLLAYVAYLLARAPQRRGRVTAGVMWCAMLMIVWLINPSLVAHVLIQLGALWLLRALLYQRSPLQAFADLGITLLSVVLGVGAYLYTASVALAIWSLFLTQALFSLLPAHSRTRPTMTSHYDGFEQAYRNAELAVRKLSIR